jgi:SAM-dependent MidA family methyltransferase
MQDALRAASVVPAFAQAIHAHMVETSPALIQLQRANLARSGVPVSWHGAIETIPPGPAIVIANEFFDALPVRHYVKNDGAWRERLVGLDNHGRFTFGLSRQAEPSIRAQAPEGSIIEICPAGQQIMNALAGRLATQGGAALIIDYGYGQTSLGETLQALQGHRFVDPLALPGQADLTAHVDFAALSRAARAAGALVCGPVTQGALLTALGIFDRARALSRRANGAQAAQIAAAVTRLVSSDVGIEVEGGMVDGMGSLFKALCVMAPGMAAPAGFETAQA